MVSDTEFTVKLVSPQSDFPLRLGYAAYAPLPKVAFDDMAAFGQNPIGNGPYKVKSWDHGNSITLEPNADYAGGRTPKNGGLKFVFYATLDAAYADLLSGNLDVLDSTPDQRVRQLRGRSGDRAINQPAAIFQSFTIPQNLAALRRRRGQAAPGGHLDGDQPGRDHEGDLQRHPNPGQGLHLPGHRRLLRLGPGLGRADVQRRPGEGEVGRGRRDLTVERQLHHRLQHRRRPQGLGRRGLQQHQEHPGHRRGRRAVRVFADIRTQITGRTIQGAFRTGWQADYPSLFNFLGPLYYTGAGSNDGDYSNPEFDKLLNEGAAATDVDAGNALFQQAQEILFADLPAIPLWYANVTGGYSEAVSGVTFGWDSVPLYPDVVKAE